MHQPATTPFRRESTRPLVLVPEGGDAETALATARTRLQASGWRIVPGLARRPSADRTVLEGSITCDEDAASAVLAAIDGYGLLVLATIEGATLHRLEDDLRRLGTLEIVEHGPPGESLAPDPEGLAILALLARGHTLGEAAITLGMSRRTADRRLAEVRRALGAERTTEAIVKATKRGWLRSLRVQVVAGAAVAGS